MPHLSHPHPPSQPHRLRATPVFPWAVDWSALCSPRAGESSDRASPVTSSHAAPSRDDASPSVLVVFGRESTGLSAEELDLCDVLVTLPGPQSSGTTNFSLNLSQAAGMLLYEVTRAAALAPAPAPTTISAVTTAVDAPALSSPAVGAAAAAVSAEQGPLNSPRGLPALNAVPPPHALAGKLWEASEDWHSLMDPRFLLTAGRPADSLARTAPPAPHETGERRSPTAVRRAKVPPSAGTPPPPRTGSHGSDLSLALRRIVHRGGVSKGDVALLVRLARWTGAQMRWQADRVRFLEEKLFGGDSDEGKKG